MKYSCQLVRYGGPQDSIQVPLLFLIKINDQMKAVKQCSIHVYADDTVIYVPHRKSEVEETLTLDMTNIAKGLESIKLNSQKI